MGSSGRRKESKLHRSQMCHTTNHNGRLVVNHGDRRSEIDECRSPLTAESWNWLTIMVDELLPINKRIVRNKSCARRTGWDECHKRATMNWEACEMMPQKNTIRRPSLKTTPRKTTLACIGVSNHPRPGCLNEDGQAMVEVALVLPV